MKSRCPFQPAIRTKWFGMLSDRTLKAAARLYAIFIRNRCTRASAGYMLDDGISYGEGE
ncbi:hypothetical protein PILCRDRAFT_810761 [Piloderma croceum F 1598]|uniref:Uncharacterized protein n=1 Tax=Piloderma croceum (strain F 1598) TaxID=765440 RepID=A0A0C3CP26_PILCF|nr:hypothetical protein PILCRDRAFT_810761 [Piloderma croceum F 1598]